MTTLSRVFRIGTARTTNGRAYSIFVEATYGEGRLLLHGVEGPLPSGNCIGSCGQIDMHEWNIVTYASGWSAELERELRQIWKQWHLVGAHGLRTQEVPQEVIDQLFSMPETDRKPAWV